MKFCSTRGGARGTSFEGAIGQGYAPDGGLYVPETMPHIHAAEMERWRALSFPQLAAAIWRLFIESELDGVDLEEFAQSCYRGFSCEEVVPLQRLGGFFVAELFHGPTFCFKDLGLQPLVRLLALFAHRRGDRHTLLVSTTGDTGPAVMQAGSDSGSSNLDMILFFPKGQISNLQRRQMTTLSSERARVMCFEGGGDDMDEPIKRLGLDRVFAARHGLCGVNSYNIGRPIAQIIHYYWSYFRALDQAGLETGVLIDFVVPAGALGNLAAGFMAKRMGLPVRKFVAGVNPNDITHRTISRGEFHRSDHMKKTLSDAINIQTPYNMERIFYYLTEENPDRVTAWYRDMQLTGRFTLPAPWLAKLQETFSSARVDDEAVCGAIRRALERHGYLSDPHTAVALAAAWELYGEKPQNSAPPVVVLSTASPCKFEEAMCVAIGAKRWSEYADSPSFPKAARAVLQAPELPPTMLQRAGSLLESQGVWESEVRHALDGNLANPGVPQARL